MSSLLSRKLQKAHDCFRANNFSGAEILCREILSKARSHPDALHLLGVLCLASEKPGEAATLIVRALEADPNNTAMLGNLGAAYLAAENFGQAELVLRRAQKLDARNVPVGMRLGIALARQGKYADAVPVLRAVADLAPAEPGIHQNLGNALAGQGDIPQALESFRRVVALRPEHAGAWFDIGVLHQRLECFDDARAAYIKTLTLDAGHRGALNNLGWVFRQTGQFEQAADCYRTLLALAPDDFGAHHNLGIINRCMGNLDEACLCYERAMTIAPFYVDAIIGLGAARGCQGRFAESQACFEKALLIAPASADARYSLGINALAMGDWERGWLNYKARPTRLLAEIEKTVEGNLSIPDEPCTLLLLNEQGIGDELFFLRFAAVLKKSGFVLRCLCDQKIKSIVERTGIFEQVVVPGDPVPPSDLQLLVGDLPLLLSEWWSKEPGIHAGIKFGAKDAGVGRPTRWREIYEIKPLKISPSDTHVAAMTARIAGLGPRPYIGLTWRSGTSLDVQHARVQQSLCKEVSLESLIPALKTFPGTLFALQRQPESGEIDGLSQSLGRPVHDFSWANDDLESMLALLALLDEYVGVSNTNMHLQAGLGKTARVLLPHPPEWRWMVTGISPWFSSFSVYRQAVDLGWDSAMDRLADDVCRAFDQRGGGSTRF